MKQFVDSIAVKEEQKNRKSVSAFVSVSPYLRPFDDQLVKQLIDYQAYDAELAFCRLRLS